MRIRLLRLRIPLPWIMLRPRPSAPSAPSPLQVEAGSATARGGRADNQDRCATGDGWVVLSDGMGGYPGGAQAAGMTVEAAAEVLRSSGPHPSVVVLEALRQANQSVRAARSADPAVARMGATATIAAAAGPSEWVVANLGDSPAWRVSADTTELLTEEHNVAGELLRQGSITAAEASDHPGKRMLVKAIGIEDEPVPALRSVGVHRGDRLILASDGLGGGVDTALLHERLGPSGRRSADGDAALLVEAAIIGGTTDNVTVAVLRFA